MSILGTALPAANTLATLYEVPTGRRTVLNAVSYTHLTLPTNREV